MAGYNETTGAPKYQPFTQKFTEAEFNQTKGVGGFEGYEVKVLSKPSDYEISQGDLKRQLATGPLLGQASTEKGPAGSIATTAAATLAQTQGEVKLEGDHLLTPDNVLRKESEQPTGTVLQYDASLARQTTNAGNGVLDTELKDVTGEPGPQGDPQSVELNDQRALVVPNLNPLELKQDTAETQDGPFANNGLIQDPAPGTTPAAPQTPKQKLQADYERVVGTKPSDDLTMKELAEQIDKHGK